MKNEAKKFVTHQAWVEGKWERDVVLSIAADGTWASVLPNASAAQQAGATRLVGVVLPGVVNAHSHALQRTRAGLTERRSALAFDVVPTRPSALPHLPHLPHLPQLSVVPRDRRLSPAQRVTPAQLEAVASQLYAEMLLGGYTHVCEFLYLHHAASAEPLEMAQALVRAAQQVGLGLTLLPALAPRGGVGGALGNTASDDARTLADGPEQVMRVVETINRQAIAAARLPSARPTMAASGPVLVSAGVGLHAQGTGETAVMQTLAAAARKTGLPVHIPIAEHQAAVDECLARTGQRPIEWLLSHADVDARWNLVHATHATAAELQAMRSAGAAIVTCPSTAANLGHGVFDLPAFAAMGGHWSIGSDRNVARSWPEELRQLEYAHRLQRQPRHVATQAAGRESSAAVLFDAAVAGGQAATGQRVGPIQVGRRADFLVLDARSNSLLGLPVEHQLDALLFSSPAARFREVFVAGVQVVKDCCVVGPQNDAVLASRIGDIFVPTMQALYTPVPSQA